MKVTTKINLMPQNQFLLGINYEANHIVKDPNNYDPSAEHPVAHTVEIGILILVIKLTFWEGY